MVVHHHDLWGRVRESPRSAWKWKSSPGSFSSSWLKRYEGQGAVATGSYHNLSRASIPGRVFGEHLKTAIDTFRGLSALLFTRSERADVFRFCSSSSEATDNLQRIIKELCLLDYTWRFHCKTGTGEAPAGNQGEHVPGKL